MQYLKPIFLILALSFFPRDPLLSLIVLGFLAWWHTSSVQTAPEQQQFIVGKAPNPLPSGFHKGSTNFYRATWLGKKFMPAEHRGINVFSKDGGEKEAYPFKTYFGPGLRDSSVETMKIDYQLPEVPFYARPILDEIVEVVPGKYLGKIHYRLIPGYPFTIGYFWLQK